MEGGGEGGGRRYYFPLVANLKILKMDKKRREKLGCEEGCEPQIDDIVKVLFLLADDPCFFFLVSALLWDCSLFWDR